VIVPIFALANAGIEISEEFLARAATSPITLGSSATTPALGRLNRHFR
jgi:Na+/H+ antiporter NhaA